MNEMQTFSDVVSSFVPSWRGLDVKAVVDDESSVLLGLVACLLPEPDHYRKRFDTGHGIRFVRESYNSSSALFGLLQGLEAGIFRDIDRSYSTKLFDPNTARCSALEYASTTSPFGPVSDDLIRGWPDLQQYRRFSLQLFSSMNLREALQLGGSTQGLPKVGKGARME